MNLSDGSVLCTRVFELTRLVTAPLFEGDR